MEKTVLRRKPNTSKKKESRAELYILTDNLQSRPDTMSLLRTDMTSTCIQAFLQPIIDTSSVCWAPRHLHKSSVDRDSNSGVNLDRDKNSGVNFVDAALYVTPDLKEKVQKSQTFLPTLAVCIGTTSDKIMVLDIRTTAERGPGS